MSRYAIVERNNRLAVHGLFDTKERADRHLTVNVPEYVRRGYYMDKTLTAADFVVIEMTKP